MQKFNPEDNLGQMMGRIVKIKTKEEADQFLADYIANIDQTREPGEDVEYSSRDIALQNIGYCSGYYSREESKRILELFDTVHPIFGKDCSSPEEAFKKGIEWVEKHISK